MRCDSNANERCPGEICYPHATAYIPFTSCPMILVLFWESIALEIITGVVSTANVAIPSDNL